MPAFIRALGLQSLTGKFLWSTGGILLVLFAGLFTWRYNQVSKPITDQFMEQGETLAISLAHSLESITSQDIRNGATLSNGSTITGEKLKEMLFDDTLTVLPESKVVTENRLKDPAYASAKQVLFDGSEIPLWQYEQKYISEYDVYTDERWQGVIDSFAMSEAVVFALPIAFSDNKETAGYIATHNTEYSPTGEISKDSWGSEGLLSQKYRANRVFNDATGYNAAAYKDKETPLFQTYPRVIEGKIVTMWDISYPIYFEGKHWGGVRVAMSKQRADEMIAEQRRDILGQYLIMFVSIMIVMFFLTLILVRRRINRLTATTKNMFLEGRVDLMQHFETSGKDEIGLLSVEINTLVRYLRELVLSIRSTSSEVIASTQLLAENVLHTKTSAVQLHGTMQEVDKGAAIQAAGAREGADAMEEMASNVMRIAGSSSDIAASSQDTLIQFQQSNQHVENVSRRMQGLLVSTLEVKETIKRLNELSGNISSFATFITTISNQTNILSLNASIEASRAGDHGKGFQVIAGEVRKLAEQSRESSDKIIEMITAIQEYANTAASEMENNSVGVQESVEAVEQVAEALKKILEATQKVDANVQEVSATSEQMSASVQQVTSTIEDIASISDASSKHISLAAASYQKQLQIIEQIAQSSENLNQLAGELKSGIQLFKID